MLFENINRLAGVELDESFKQEHRSLKKESTEPATPTLPTTKEYTEEELCGVLAGMIEHLRAEKYEIPDDMTAFELIQELCNDPELQEEAEYLAEYGLTELEFEEVPPSNEIEKQALKKLSQNEWFMKVSGSLYESDNSFAQKATDLATKVKSKFVPGPAVTGEKDAPPSAGSTTLRTSAVHHLLHKAGLGNYSEEEKKEFAKKELETAEKHLKDAKTASDTAYKKHMSEMAKGRPNSQAFRQWKQASEDHRAASEYYLHARKQIHEVAEFGAAISEMAIALAESGYELPDNYTVQDLFHSITQTPELASFIASDSYRQLTEYEKQVSASPEAALMRVPVSEMVQETIASEWELQNLYTILNAWNENRDTIPIAEEDQKFAEEMDALTDLVVYLEDNQHDLGDYVTIPGVFDYVDQRPELKDLQEDPEYVQLREGFAKKASRFLKHAAIGVGAAGLALGSVPALAAGIGAHVAGKLITKGAKAYKKIGKEERQGFSKEKAREVLHHAKLAKEIASHERRLNHHYAELERKKRAIGVHPTDSAHSYLLPSHVS